MPKPTIDMLASQYVVLDHSRHPGRWKKRSNIRKRMIRRFDQKKVVEAIARAEETFKLLCPPPPPQTVMGMDPASTKIKWYTGLNIIGGQRPKLIILDDLTP